MLANIVLHLLQVNLRQVNLLQDGPPDTINYLILGYVIMAVVGLGYVITLVWRQRNLQRDLDVLDKLDQDDE